MYLGQAGSAFESKLLARRSQVGKQNSAEIILLDQTRRETCPGCGICQSRTEQIRIVMMTNGPSARIGEILDVELARPRRRLELASDPAYIRSREGVLKFLYERHRFVEAAA